MAIPIKSAPVPTGVKAQHQEYNKLRRDVLTHVHDGNSALVDHTDLESIGSNTHTEIDTHIAASAGVHGGGASDYVVVSKVAGQIIQKGTFTHVLTDCTGLSWNESGGYHEETFDTAFAVGTTPIVFLQAYNNTVGLEDAWVTTDIPTNITNEGFTVYFFNHQVISGSETLRYMYIAIGV